MLRKRGALFRHDPTIIINPSSFINNAFGSNSDNMITVVFGGVCCCVVLCVVVCCVVVLCLMGYWYDEIWNMKLQASTQTSSTTDDASWLSWKCVFVRFLFSFFLSFFLSLSLLNLLDRRSRNVFIRKRHARGTSFLRTGTTLLPTGTGRIPVPYLTNFKTTGIRESWARKARDLTGTSKRMLRLRIYARSAQSHEASVRVSLLEIGKP